MSKVVFTGHRPQSLPGGFRNTKLHQQIKDGIKRTLTLNKPDIAISGMALGMDQWGVEVCIKLGIPFIAALPFEGQENKWPPKSQEHYKWLLSKAIKIVYVDREKNYVSSDVAPGVYHPYKMFRRNEWMIDQLEEGDTLLSLWDQRDRGGTYQCIKYATETCNRVHHVNISLFNGIPKRTTYLIQQREDYDDVSF